MEQHKALSLFQPSNLAKAIRLTQDPSSNAPKHLLGSIMAFPHTKVARSVAVLGFDFVLVDALHTYATRCLSRPSTSSNVFARAINVENLVQLIQTINLASEGRTCAVVRVPGINSDILTHALDAGQSVFTFLSTCQ